MWIKNSFEISPRSTTRQGAQLLPLLCNIQEVLARQIHQGNDTNSIQIAVEEIRLLLLRDTMSLMEGIPKNQPPND